MTIQILEFETLENKEDVGVCSIPTPGTKCKCTVKTVLFCFIFMVRITNPRYWIQKSKGKQQIVIGKSFAILPLIIQSSLIPNLSQKGGLF